MIYKKLLDFQKLGIKVEKDAVNPHYKSRYASLNEVLDKATKPLNDLGVVIIQRPQRDGLETILHDTEDDTMMISFVPFVNATDMQKLGGAITYARRYSLIAMLGLEDEDDDGERTMERKAPADKPLDPAFSRAVPQVSPSDDLAF